MPQVKELLIEELQDLLDAETQLTAALPKMVQAAHHPKLKEAFEKHLVQTQVQVERLRAGMELLGAKADPKPCKGMMGLIAEGEETIKKGAEKEPLAADLALIAAAQRVEHYEISAYGTARSLARQSGEIECAKLLSHTLGEEESADFLLTTIADPLVQQLSLDAMGAGVELDSEENRSASRRKKASKTAA